MSNQETGMAGAGQGGEARGEVPAGDVLVGVNYFAGWWDVLPNKWEVPAGRDWRPLFPGRIPLLGEYNDQATMDREIAAAASHGVDFFQILWYNPVAGMEDDPHTLYLNRGLTNFLASPENHRMKFVLEYCNHPPFGVTTDETWEEWLAVWLPALAHPGCLRVGGRIVFKVHGAHYFMQQHDNDVAQARRRLDRLRAAAREAGLGEMLIGGGVMAHTPVPAGDPVAQIFDFTNTYMDIPDLPVPAAGNLPYEELAALARDGRLGHAADVIPYVPYLPAGWNPRPWGDPRPPFAFPTCGEWEAALAWMAVDLATQPRLGLPLPDGGRQKIFTIYAWNEFGEGGIVAPTRGELYKKLNGIERVFGGK